LFNEVVPSSLGPVVSPEFEGSAQRNQRVDPVSGHTNGGREGVETSAACREAPEAHLLVPSIRSPSSVPVLRSIELDLDEHELWRDFREALFDGLLVLVEFDAVELGVAGECR
jgi:hypothetical protein